MSYGGVAGGGWERIDNGKASSIADLAKKYKHNPFTRFTTIEPVEVIPTGSLLIDQALGVWGIPEGRITMCYGPYSGGKSTLALSICAQAQKKYPDKLVGWVDAENAFDPKRSQQLGVTIENVAVVQSNSGEEAWDTVEALLREKLCSIIVIDSLPFLTPMAEVEADFDKQQIGALSRLSTKAMRKVGPIVAQSGTPLFIINQIRANTSGYGNPESIPGGFAVQHAASVIMRVAKVEFVKQGEEIIGITSKVEVTKNKCAPPKRIAEFTILFESGIDSNGELIDVGIEQGIIVKSGSWFKYGDVAIGQGKNTASRWLEENPQVAQDIVKAIHDHHV